MAHYIAALDSGKGLSKLIIANFDDYKACKDSRRLSVVTKYTELKEDQYEEATKDSHLVEFNGGRFIVGKQGRDNSLLTTKCDPVHKLCSYAAITKALEPGVENTITMVLACPVLALKSQDEKEKYKKFMTNDGNLVEITVDGKEYKFKFDNVILKSEASGIIYFDAPTFEASRVGILDLGHLNMTFLEYNDGVINTDNRYIFDYGCNKLEGMLQESLSLYRQQNVSDETVREALRRGALINVYGEDANSIPVINETKTEFIMGILDLLVKKSIMIADYNSIIVTGGTSLYLDKLIPLQIPNAVLVEDPQWACIEGLFGLAVAFAESLCK